MKFPNIECEITRNNMNKEVFCSKLKISRKTYFNWQNKGNIPSKKLEVMANLFDCSTDYLLGLKENRSNQYIKAAVNNRRMKRKGSERMNRQETEQKIVEIIKESQLTYKEAMDIIKKLEFKLMEKGDDYLKKIKIQEIVR